MAEAHIDLAALRSNAGIVRSLAPASALMAVIKANAYGHGMLPVAKALQHHVEGFAVARLDEAMLLRQQGIDKRLLVLSALPDLDQLRQSAEANIEIALHDPATVQLLLGNRFTRPIGVWLKVDTGMHRLGMSAAAALEAYPALQASASIGQITLMSHFASADDVNSSFTNTQLERMEPVLRALPNAPASVANSAAIITRSDSHRDWVRPGIMLYGANPLGEAASPRLRPVMTLKSRLLAVRHIEAGDSVGYNQTWISPRATCIGAIAIGYGDGYPRHAPSGAPVLVNRRRVPLVGRVSMDTISVDLGPHSHDKTGDEAILWGEGLAVNEVAHCAGTISYELLTRVTARVRYYYSDNCSSDHRYSGNGAPLRPL